MIQKFKRDKESSLEQIRGEDAPPRILSLCLHVAGYEQLATQHIAFDPGDTGVQK
jgi:hypothetical protein